MAWQRRWRIDSQGKWLAILRALTGLGWDFAARPCELLVRTERVEKTEGQRRLFHAVCADLAPHWGMTPEGVKAKVKEGFYGGEVHIGPGRLTEDEVATFMRLLAKVGPYTVVVQSSEDSDREEYGRLIDHAYQMAAESEVYLADRRTR
jgi:hypothetical protein